MAEVRGGFDFPEKSFGTQCGGELGTEDLNGHLAVVPYIFSEVDRRHAAGPNLTLDAVAVGEGRGEAGWDLVHEVAVAVLQSAVIVAPAPGSAQEAR
jgi:hypothetical protein